MHSIVKLWFTLLWPTGKPTWFDVVLFIFFLYIRCVSAVNGCSGIVNILIWIIRQYMWFEMSFLCSHIPSYSRFPRTFRTRRAATGDLSRLWQDGVIPYQIQSNFTGFLMIHKQKIYMYVLQVNKKSRHVGVRN